MMIDQIRNKINFKTKPLGSLGVLEQLAEQICLVQNTLSPELKNPTILVFAADHGITQEGISAYPAEVTPQMVLNFLNGGAAINVFSQQHNIQLKIIDAGVNYEFESHPHLIHAKIAKGTSNFLSAQAMTDTQLTQCFEHSGQIIDGAYSEGCNIIGFGEMGIGNTSSASMLMSVLCGLPIEECVGRGTGLDDHQLQHKVEVLSKARDYHGDISDAKIALQCFGGFEIAQICGGMIAAYERNMLIMVDGFIATAAFLCAYHIQPNIIKNAIFCHQSDEQGHQKMLTYLKVKPLLNIAMRLGEGTGCAIAYPLIHSAVKFINDMASFESAGVSQKE